MEWGDTIPVAHDWYAAISAQLPELQEKAAYVYTTTPTALFISPTDNRLATFNYENIPVPGYDAITLTNLRNEPWVKVAIAETIRRPAEFLNFLPGTYFAGIPNSPSPVAAAITTGLLGAGLGYGAGKIMRKIAPEKYGDKLPRTAAVLGGLLGATPGLAWGGVNLLAGRSVNDNTLLNFNPGDAPDYTPENWQHGTNAAPLPEEIINSSWFRDELQERANFLKTKGLKLPAALNIPSLSSADSIQPKMAAEMFAADPTGTGIFDVNLDGLGRTLWQSGASPGLITTAIGAMHTAQQFPDSNAPSNVVTGEQLAQLTGATIGNYARGYIIGGVLNQVVGTPYRAGQFGAGAAALGILGAAIPKLFGS